jgi:hypothetical protein
MIWDHEIQLPQSVGQREGSIYRLELIVVWFKSGT